MKICIIGGGFYGCYFAIKIKKKYPNSEVTIFEKNNDILLESAINNQYRLHYGFHYPRSPMTIKQTLVGSKKFIKEFKKYIYFPKKNIYAIHKKSKINFKKYTKIFIKYKIPFKNLERNQFDKYFINPKLIEGAILTGEGVIDLNKLYKDIKKKYLKNIKIIKRKKVVNLDPNGTIFFDNKQKKKFDLIFNTTFVNPNLGLKKGFNIKYELSAMAYVKNFLSKDLAITIMDGNYISAYPLNNRILSLSSVKYTPIYKTKSLENLIKFQKSGSYKIRGKKIIEDANRFLIIPNKLKIKKISVAPKVKILNDKGSKRTANFIKKKKLFSVLCGKLDAAPILWKNIEKKLL